MILELSGSLKYTLYLQGEERSVPADWSERIDYGESWIGGSSPSSRIWTGQGSLIERLGSSNRAKRFLFITEPGIGLTPRTFLIPTQFDGALQRGYSANDVNQLIEKNPLLLIDYICAAKLDEIDTWERAEKERVGEHRVLIPTLKFGPINRHILAIWLERMPWILEPQDE